MAVTDTIEINGEEREIADAYAREQCAGLNNNLSVIGKCKNLLNPTLATTTENGVTCTNNGDGTFTLNGTATAITQFKLMDLNKAYAKKVKLLGTPKNGGNTNFYVYFITSDGIRSDLNNGRFIDSNITINNLCLWVNNGIVCKNVIFKPMLTTNLNATYDDFVPYTGDGETLTHDVAELKNDLIILEASTQVVMTSGREFDDKTDAITIPSGYEPIAMYGYNSNNNDNISVTPLRICSDGRVLYHAKNHSESDQGTMQMVARITFKKMS